MVHHGGIGTCAAGLAAGIPQVVVPRAFDQPDNAARLVRLGVGTTLSPKHYTPHALSHALGRLLGSADTRAACARCAGRKDWTANVQRVVSEIEQLALQRSK